jgi:hypothetical protein
VFQRIGVGCCELGPRRQQFGTDGERATHVARSDEVVGRILRFEAGRIVGAVVREDVFVRVDHASRAERGAEQGDGVGSPNVSGEQECNRSVRAPSNR